MGSSANEVRKMHICIICHEASLTGAPRVGFDIALYLADRHEVTLLAKKGGELIDLPAYVPLRSRYRVLNTNHEVCNLTYRERVAHATALLQELEPDLLYVNSVASGEWCEAGARADVPVVLHTHETRESLPSLLSSVSTPRILAWTNFLIGASQQALIDLQEVTSTSMSEGDCLDLGIFIDVATVLAQSEADVEPAVNARGTAWEPAGGRAAVAMCGLAQPRKGADIFFELAMRIPQYDFVWIGPWDPREADANSATFERYSALKIANFFATGLTSNPYAHIRQASTFLLTSRKDPNPLVVAEALVLGRKVVAFAETGASTAMLEKHGYALTGSPDVERLVSLLPKIVEGEPAWQADVAERVRSDVDGARKLARLNETLGRLVTKERRGRPVANA